MKVENLLATKTFLATVGYVFLTEANPLIEAAIQQETISTGDWLRLIKTLIFAIIIVTLRHEETDTITYTPTGILGRNKDVAERIKDRMIAEETYQNPSRNYDEKY